MTSGATQTLRRHVPSQGPDMIPSAGVYLPSEGTWSQVLGQRTRTSSRRGSLWGPWDILTLLCGSRVIPGPCSTRSKHEGHRSHQGQFS